MDLYAVSPEDGGAHLTGSLAAVDQDNCLATGIRTTICRLPEHNAPGVRGSQTYRMRAALPKSDTENTTVVFLELFPPVAYPEVMLMLLSASFIANFPPERFGPSDGYSWDVVDSIGLRGH